MVVSCYSKLAKLLKENGCNIVRQGKGSHEIWQSPNGAVFAVPSNIVSKHF
jgi:predicted RNA binding protein YcfA (HicA-like mRNA interferase family)